MTSDLSSMYWPVLRLYLSPAQPLVVEITAVVISARHKARFNVVAVIFISFSFRGQTSKAEPETGAAQAEIIRLARHQVTRVHKDTDVRVEADLDARAELAEGL